MTFSDLELEAATVAYLRKRGWDDATIAKFSDTKEEVRDRMRAALEAIDKVRGVSNEEAR